MKFAIKIESDNAAMVDYPGEEVGRILRETAGEVEAGLRRGELRDINGNIVGHWTIKH